MLYEKFRITKYPSCDVVRPPCVNCASNCAVPTAGGRLTTPGSQGDVLIGPHQGALVQAPPYIHPGAHPRSLSFLTHHNCLVHHEIVVIFVFITFVFLY